MKIFVCEFITSGGLYREALTNRLVKEGLMMRDALLEELAEIEGVEVICCYDHRLSAPLVKHPVRVDDDEAWQIWQEQIKASDATWLIAPETSGILLRLTEYVIAQGKPLLGCPASMVKLTTSKFQTYQALKQAGVAVVATYAIDEWLSMLPQVDQGLSWVIKPDDGVSCEDAVCLDQISDIVDWIEQGGRMTHIVQPLILGEPASLSMLCRNGVAWLLSCNRQKIAKQASHFSYEGSTVNGFAEYWLLFAQLANQIARALPELAGYVGVDVIINDRRQLEVLEINPRLTTSYVGLGEATDTNVAKLVLDLLNPATQGKPFTLPEITRKKVEVIA